MSNNINETVNNFINKDNGIHPLSWVYPNKKEFVEWINRTFIKYRIDDKLLKTSKKFIPFKYQQFLRDYMQNNSPYRGILLYHGLGSGKCHAKDSKIIMHDGTIKLVQNINVGDFLMGDDSTPRKVLSLARGKDKMYDVIQENGNKYTVNEEHILCLANEEHNIIEISIKDYLELSKSEQESLKGYKVKVEFEEKALNIDPYSVGLSICRSEYIPFEYKCNSRYNRLKLLAGIIDNYGILSKSKKDNTTYNYKLNINNPTLTYDILYLIRSLGFSATEKNQKSKYNIIIYGIGLEEIPLLNKSKKIINIDTITNTITNTNTNTNTNQNSISTINNIYSTKIDIKYVGIDDYYGFMLDDNCRYLMDDMTVTHNTCTAIEIAENLKTDKNIVVMLPASLRINFIEKGLLFCGDELYINNPSLYKDKYSFISYNANNTLSQIKKIGSFDNKVIIIEEVHNLISKMMSGLMGISKTGLEIYRLLMEAQNVKIIAMSGTPVINDPFEAAILCNILRGYIELTYFRIVKVPPIYGEQWKLDDVEAQLASHPLIDYLEINKLNKSIEFHIKIPNYSVDYQGVLKSIEDICINKGIIVKFLELQKIPLFPTDDDGESFRNYFVKEDIEKGDLIKNENVFKRRILGLISYFSPSLENYPTVIKKDYYRIEMSDYQFQIYELLRAKERLSEKGGKSRSKKSKQVKSTFRVFSRQASNFVFPEEINRPYPDPAFIVSLLKNGNNNKTESNKKNKKSSVKYDINKLLELEDQANENGKMSIQYKNRIETALKFLIEHGNKYFTPGPEGLDKLSPKMGIILDNINKSKGLVFVYSNFRTLEGIEIFSKVLDFNGYSKFIFDKNKHKVVNKSLKNKLNNTFKGSYAIYSGVEDEEQKRELLKIFTSSENKNGSIIKIILATSAGAEGLDLKNIRQIHIMEPYWNQMRIEQVIGRGVRRDSHIELPVKDRNVEIYRYFSILPQKDIRLTKDKLSTDDHIEQISLKKQKIISQITEIFKECSFDCFLNSSDKLGKFKCFNFGSNAKGYAYNPNLSKDIIENVNLSYKTKKKSFTKGVYFDKHVYLYNDKKKQFYLYNDSKKTPSTIDIKKTKIIYIDKTTNEVYDKKSVNAGNPLLIGIINENNKLLKK